MQIQIRHGLDLALAGEPRQTLAGRLACTRTAHLMTDYVDVRARAVVDTGERVARGQSLCVDRQQPAIVFSAHCSGVVERIETGAGRRVERIVVRREDDAAIDFGRRTPADIGALTPDALASLLQRAGCWPAFRARPFGRIAPTDIAPRALFITAIDTEPGAPAPARIIAGRQQDFDTGLRAIARLSDGITYVCTAPDPGFAVPSSPRITHMQVGGPHPAGLPGTHIQAAGLPVGNVPDLWHIGYQDVIAIGSLLIHGQLDSERVIAVGGPGSVDGALLTATLGSDLGDADRFAADASATLVSGSPLHGSRHARYLGRYHSQLTWLAPPVAGERRGWRARVGDVMQRLGRPAVVAETAQPRPGGMLAVEAIEQAWPFAVPALPLLRALLSGDAEHARQLGCLGLTEDDLALSAFLCPAGRDYGRALRTVLRQIEKRA